MGMIRCPVHGLTFMQLCCEHIADAIDAKRYEHANPLVDTFGVPMAVCDPCLEKALAETAGKPEWTTMDLDIGVPIFPYCSEDLREWYAATGQGDLSERIAELKRRLGIGTSS